MSDGQITRYDVTLAGAMGPALCTALGSVRVAHTSRAALFRLRCHADCDLIDLDEKLAQRGLSVISIRLSRSIERGDTAAGAPGTPGSVPAGGPGGSGVARRCEVTD